MDDPASAPKPEAQSTGFTRWASPRAPDRGPAAEPAAPALVTTKLSPPPAPHGRVGAGRILGWADEMAQHLLTVIRAPAGYGKTTAAAMLAEQLSLSNPTAWVSFDPGDRDPDLGPIYVADALRKMGLDLPSRVLEPASDRARAEDAVSTAQAAISALQGQAGHYFLFLDDFDHLGGDASARFMAVLLANAPANFHLVVTCRGWPRLPLDDLRRRRALLVKSVDALSLDLSEARKLVSARGALSRDQIAGLHQATQGWVTGIKLGAIALLKSGSATDDVGAAIHEAQWLDAYLTESVFSRLPPEMCALLASCAVPDRVNGALAAALSGLPRAADMLAWLWEQNTFLQREEGQDGWYRLHPVFREFLLLRLRARGGVPEAHEAAARFFLAAEQPLDAARHAIESGNAGLALEGVERAAMGMVERANLSTLLDWIARLPPASVARRLPLSVARAWALALTGRRDVVEVIADVERFVARHPDADTEALRADLAGIRSLAAVIVEDDSEAARDLAMTFLRRRNEQSSFAARAVRNTAALCCTLSGDFARARELMAPAHLVSDEPEQPLTMAYAQYVLSMGSSQQGRHAEGERIARESLARLEAAGGANSGSAAVASVLAARYLYERNELDQADEVLHERLSAIDEVCFPDAMISAYRTLVGVRLARRDHGAAARLVERAEGVAEARHWARLGAACAALRARLRLPQMVDLDALERDIDWSAALDAHPLSRPARMAQTVAEALIIEKLRQGDLGGAGKVVERSLVLTRRSILEGVKIKMLKADLLQRMERPQAAEAVIADLIWSSAPRQALRCILDSTSIGVLDGFEHTASYAALSDTERAHFRAVAAARAQDAGGAMPANSNRTQLTDLMTQREIDVLRQLAAGLSNKEIARRVNMMPGTVKWHVRNVLRKLDTETRRHAVRKALAMGLSLAS